MADVFLSYAREDRAKAEQIARALTAGGYDVFWDVEIPPGTSWADFLAEKLATSKAAIVLWSTTSTASQWVREEARLAQVKSKLIPVLIEDCAPPFGFGEIQAANLTGWNGEADNANWKLLLAGITHAVGAGPTGQAKAAPIKAAVSGGWDSGRAGAQSAEPAKKKQNWPLLIGGGVVGVLVLLGIIGSMNGGGSGGSGPSSPEYPAPTQALSPEVQAAVSTAQEAVQAANAAMQEATAKAASGQQAANAAQSGMGGFGVSQGPMGAIAGDLMGVQSGREAPVGVAMAQGSQFYGTMHMTNMAGNGYVLNGNVAVPGGASASGRWDYSGASYAFVGGGAIPNKWSVQAREQGSTDGSGVNGVGQIRYANGEVYVGQYRAVGEGAQAQVFRNGLGVHYDARGAVMNAGRFDNDSFTG